MPVPGGVLIRDTAGEIIGAAGISGDTSDKDETCAVYGIACAGLTPDTGDHLSSGPPHPRLHAPPPSTQNFAQCG